MAELFWLNNVQWAAIEPLLPHWGGKPRVDDRRIISGILHRFREGLRWRALPDEYGPRTTVSTGSIVGANADYGSSCLRPLRDAQTRRCLQWWTAQRFAHTGWPLAQKGDAEAGDRPLPRRSDYQNPCDVG